MDNMEISFRKVETENDWNIFLEIEKEVAKASEYYFAWTNLDDLKQNMEKSVIFLAYYQGKPIGHVEYRLKDIDQAEITGLVVLPKYQGMGAGKILFKKAMDDLSKIKKIFLMTNPENTRALLVYLKAGFKIKEWKDNFYGNGQPRLRLELNK